MPKQVGVPHVRKERVVPEGYEVAVNEQSGDWYVFSTSTKRHIITLTDGLVKDEEELVKALTVAAIRDVLRSKGIWHDD